VIRPARAADNAQIAAIWNAEALATAATPDTEREVAHSSPAGSTW